jgi:hypothetical protein
VNPSTGEVICQVAEGDKVRVRISEFFFLFLISLSFFFTRKWPEENDTEFIPTVH